MTLQAFLVDASTGATIQRLTAATPEAFGVVPAGADLVFYDGAESIETLETFRDGEAVQVRARVYDLGLLLDIAKVDARAAVMQQRDCVELGGCMTPLGRFDTDADSQRKVNGSVTMALIAQTVGQPFSVEWTMEDNSTVNHDAAAMIAAGIAVGQHVSACHARGVDLKAAIDAAESLAALAAINIEEGWP